ncbi:WhiB family transcriptional regulator [Amycolatopsis sp. NPDC051071]|uniref:WhiB family transcriptional regulator n=1 Tax=Amycolatopsis sp. NPDC051071 TaxID=3154637 RepID=UPI003424685D
MEMMMAGDLSEAACRGEDPELFFPVTETGPGARQVTRAKAVCARCPVTSACLAYALDNGLAHGVFGGLTGSERRRPLRVRSAA